MGFHCYSLLLLIMVIAVKSYHAYASICRPLAIDDPTSALFGICASSVTIHNYKCQEIDVKTQDGYILNMKRIPEVRHGGAFIQKQLILIQHGVLVGVGLAVSFFLQAWCISQKGPLFSAMFNPLCTVIVTIIAAIFLHEETYTGRFFNQWTTKI